ncbi:NADH oxidase [Aureimonas sp. Leaf460]|uniref:hybrid-cluster NAD(P)-dependent oxidoreductase n=2 Tax=unclassified Aureimonas TaxID=2615206 RepID=UPI0006F7D720|nr:MULTISPECIES: hybrid-cluster NAD(P)-dependent oxidoreductase [unclassified Aureimonas]KQT61186.1 NADH oxidase [Aureimonas sp. Leaf427]KQT62955.1 NADH oxidase [Aureimonas sp. Leaf460]
MPLKPRPKHLDEMRPWNDKAQVLECVQVLTETRDVKTFSFLAADDSWFRYTPGQFVTFELPMPGGAMLRTYTLSSSPSRPLSVSVTVKAQNASVASRWMLDNVTPGTRLKAYGPAGIFTFHNHPADKYLFVSAGSGITPMMSMTRYLFDVGQKTDVSFIHCARSPADIIFRSELERMAARVPDIDLAWIVEQPDALDGWTGYKGRINALMLELIAPDYQEREVFCCGPAIFMQTVRDILNAAGFDMSRYHEESFSAPVDGEGALVESAGPLETLPQEGAAAKIVFKGSGVEADCLETDTILKIAKEIGLNIPSACTFGVCGTCRVEKISGEVHMAHNGGISEDEIEEGFILACCSRPIGRVEVDV